MIYESQSHVTRFGKIEVQFHRRFCWFRAICTLGLWRRYRYHTETIGPVGRAIAHLVKEDEARNGSQYDATTHATADDTPSLSLPPVVQGGDYADKYVEEATESLAPTIDSLGPFNPSYI